MNYTIEGGTLPTLILNLEAGENNYDRRRSNVVDVS